MASSSLSRTLAVVVASVSLILNIAIIACAANALSVFTSLHGSTPFFLPSWAQHFDMRELGAQIGTAVGVALLNAIFLSTPLISATRAPVSPPLIGIFCSVLSVSIALIVVIFSTVLNSRVPSRDTLQTWTCMWRGVQNEGVPVEFNSLCNETRFAFYTTILSFVLQIVVLGLAVLALWTSRRASGVRRLQGEEKGVSLEQVQRVSISTKSWDSVRRV